MKQATPREDPSRARLLPTLGLFSTICLVVGGIIGSGIFRKPGTMAAQVGSPELLLGVWLLAGLITLFGALTNAEIAAMIPETGGQYVFYERMYGPFIAFLYGWAVFIVIQTGSIAAVAYVFAEYATWFVPLPEASGRLAQFTIPLPGLGAIVPFQEAGIKGLAALLIIVLTVVNYIGVKTGGIVQNIFTVAKTVALLLLVVAAFTVPGVGRWENLTLNSPALERHGLAFWAGLAAALQGAFWAYDGWNKITYVAGEVKNPQRLIPRSLFIGMLIVLAVYLLANLAYVYVIPVERMATLKLVAADVAEACFPGGGRWIAVAVMISTLGAANAIILASARVYFAMARNGVFPRVLGHVHPRFHTPAWSLGVQGIWSCALLWSGTFDLLTDMLIFVSWIFYGAGAYGLFVLRRKEPATPRPYRVPGYPWVPLIFVLFSLVFLALTAVNDVLVYRANLAEGKPALLNSLLGVLLVLAGTPIYFWYRRGQHSPRKAP